MSSHTASAYIFGLFILAAYILTTSIFAVSQNNVINFICSRTSDPEYCRQVFYSKPESATAKIEDMGYIALKLASRNASSTITLILLLEKNAKQPSEFHRLARCRAKYEAVRCKLFRAKQLWQVWKVHGARDAALEGIGDLDECGNEYAGEYFRLRSQTRDMERLLRIFGDVCDVIGMNQYCQYLSTNN